MHDVAKMETSSQPNCALETLFGSVHLFCCNQGTMYDISECVVIASYCSSDTLWNASAKTIHYPCPRHSRCLVCDNHCMREPIIKKAPAHAGFDRAHCTVPTNIGPCLLLHFANKLVVGMNSGLCVSSTSTWVCWLAELLFACLILVSQ